MITVLLTCGTTRTEAAVGDIVTVTLRDENGMPIFAGRGSPRGVAAMKISPFHCVEGLARFLESWPGVVALWLALTAYCYL